MPVEDKGGIFAYITEPVRNETVSVTNSSSVICVQRTSPNPRRTILVRNSSLNANEIITVNMGNNPAVAGAGIVLKPEGSFSDSTSEGYECFQGVITAICAVAGPGSLSIMER